MRHYGHRAKVHQPNARAEDFRPGDKVFVDSYTGLVPAVVVSVTPSEENREPWHRSRNANTVAFRVTKTVGSYPKGHEDVIEARQVVRREWVKKTPLGQYRIVEPPRGGHRPNPFDPTRDYDDYAPAHGHAEDTSRHEREREDAEYEYEKFVARLDGPPEDIPSFETWWLQFRSNSSVLGGGEDPGAGTPIANPDEVDFFEDEGPLWQFQFGAYGSTNLYVWADGMDSGFEIAVEWLDDHAPGLLTMVSEEDYQQAAEELGKVWDPSEPDDEIIEAAETDMTMIGHTTLKHGNAVASWEWHAHEVERGSPEWNEVVERSRAEAGIEEEDEGFEENASLSGRDLELLSGLAEPPMRRRIPGPGDSVVYDRSYQELARRGLIVLRQDQPGMRSFADHYVLTPLGKETLRAARLPSWSVRR
jgi:hypothetical protein